MRVGSRVLTRLFRKPSKLLRDHYEAPVRSRGFFVGERDSPASAFWCRPPNRVNRSDLVRHNDNTLVLTSVQPRSAHRIAWLRLPTRTTLPPRFSCIRNP